MDRKSKNLIRGMIAFKAYEEVFRLLQDSKKKVKYTSVHITIGPQEETFYIRIIGNQGCLQCIFSSSDTSENLNQKYEYVEEFIQRNEKLAERTKNNETELCKKISERIQEIKRKKKRI